MKAFVKPAATGSKTFSDTYSALKFIILIFSIAAAYFLTLQSLKVELAAKAEHTDLARLDKKLTNIEIYLTEGLVNKKQFFTFSQDMEKRLARIEVLLEENRR